MPKYKQPDKAIPESIEKAWREGNEMKVCQAVIAKYAKVLDMTDSGRDIKPLATGMFETIDRLNALKAANEKSNAGTPLYRILNGKMDKAINE